MIEPVAYTGIFPRGGKSTQGIGDVEATLTFLALEEQKYVPAIALAGEVKIPTANKVQIGTRVADYAIYLIGSKKFGAVDVHANVAYTIVGEPSSISVKNRWSLALAAEWSFHPKWDLFGEMMYTTSAHGRGLRNQGVVSGAEGDGTTVSAEVGGVELFGTLGIKYHLRSNIDVFTSVTYDNADATLVRTGITWKF